MCVCMDSLRNAPLSPSPLCSLSLSALFPFPSHKFRPIKTHHVTAIAYIDVKRVRRRQCEREGERERDGHTHVYVCIHAQQRNQQNTSIHIATRHAGCARRCPCALLFTGEIAEKKGRSGLSVELVVDESPSPNGQMAKFLFAYYHGIRKDNFEGRNGASGDMKDACVYTYICVCVRVYVSVQDWVFCVMESTHSRLLYSPPCHPIEIGESQPTRGCALHWLRKEQGSVASVLEVRVCCMYACIYMCVCVCV